MWLAQVARDQLADVLGERDVEFGRALLGTPVVLRTESYLSPYPHGRYFVVAPDDAPELVARPARAHPTKIEGPDARAPGASHKATTLVAPKGIADGGDRPGYFEAA
jgi:hypothetical protein